MEPAFFARKEILNMGLDDVTGLYEIIWRLNTLWPGIDSGQKYRLADEALRDLQKENAVRMIRQRADHDQRRYETVAPETIDGILRNPVSWYPSVSDGPWSQMAYEITEVGVALYGDLCGRQ